MKIKNKLLKSFILLIFVTTSGVANTYANDSTKIVKPPEIIEKEYYYLDKDPSTILLELIEPVNLQDNKKLMIKRNNYLIYTIISGSKFEDKNLAYETNYEYELYFVAEIDGKEIESEHVFIKARTGQPSLKLEFNNYYDSIRDNYIFYKTIFTNKVNITGKIFYKNGGNIDIEFKDRINKINKTFYLSPYETKFFDIYGTFEDGDTSTIKASLESNNLLKSVEENILIELKSPKIENLDVEKYKDIYN